MEEGQRAVSPLHAPQEVVVGWVKRRKSALAEGVSRGALGGQDQDHVVVGRVHAVEITKVDVGVLVEKEVCSDLRDNKGGVGATSSSSV